MFKKGSSRRVLSATLLRIRSDGHVSAHRMPNVLLVMSCVCGSYAVRGAARPPRSLVIYEGGTVRPRRRRLSAQRRQALQLLASSQSGITETLLFADGVTPHMLGRLLRSGLATIQRETIKSGDQTIEIGRIMITDAGRRALETLHRPEAQ
jgi:hypothetical protein